MKESWGTVNHRKKENSFLNTHHIQVNKQFCVRYYPSIKYGNKVKLFGYGIFEKQS